MKWSALYFVPVFALLVLVWEVGVRRSAGVRRHPWRDALLDELAGWSLAVRADRVGHLPGHLDRLVRSPTTATTGTAAQTERPAQRAAGHRRADQPVALPPRGVQLPHRARRRRTSTSRGRGSGCCSAGRWRSTGPATAPAARRSCASEILLLGTPLLWWSFLPALVALVWLGHRPPRLAGRGDPARRGRRPPAVVLRSPSRTGRCSPSTPRRRCRSWCWPWSTCWARSSRPAGGDVGAVAPLVPGDPGYERRLVGSVAAGAYVLLVALCFAYFYPIFVGPADPVRGLAVPDVAGRSLDISIGRRRAAQRDGRRARTLSVRARSTKMRAPIACHGGSGRLGRAREA